MTYIRPWSIILLSGNIDMRNQCFIIGRKQTRKDGSFSNASCLLATCKMGETCSPRLRRRSSRYETFCLCGLLKGQNGVNNLEFSLTCIVSFSVLKQRKSLLLFYSIFLGCWLSIPGVDERHVIFSYLRVS